MAASPEIQIQALQSLLEVKENVDKEVHMKCVITALSTAYLDADAALKISAVLSQLRTKLVCKKLLVTKCERLEVRRKVEENLTRTTPRLRIF